MPTFKEYVDRDGFYIHARPSDAGNITYQVSPEAETFLTSIGYGDQDDLPWGLIKPLRIADLIYTEGEGVDPLFDDAGDIPALDLDRLRRASSDEQQALLEYLESRTDISPSILEEIREYIGAGSTSAFVERCESIVESEFKDKDIRLRDASVEPGSIGYVITLSTTTSGVSPALLDLDPSFDNSRVEHRIQIVDEGIDEWVVEHPTDASWEERAEVARSKAAVLTTLTEVAASTSLNLGDSDEDFAYFGPGGPV